LAREIAFDAFIEVMEHGKKPEECTEFFYQNQGKSLSRIDRNLVKEILYGGLRWYSKIFWILQHTSSRDLTKTTPQVQAALVLGTYQIFYMDRIPDRAAVNESVEYIRKKGQANACSFVNGILRQIARRAEYFAKPDKATKPAEYLSVQFAFPQWLTEKWLKHFKFEKLEVMLAAMNEPPPYFIRVNSLKCPLEQTHELSQRLLKEEKTHTERQNLRSCLRCKESPHLEDGSLFQQGYFTVQDCAAQLIGYLVEPKAGETILDATSGPGGKLTHLYELSAGKATLIGLEKKLESFERTKQNIARLQMTNIELIHTDFLEWESTQQFDKILLDAPCSGLGVLRRHPEGKWQKHMSLVNDMAAQQWKMIGRSLSMLKPGGELIFSVCSFEPEETNEHLRKLKSTMGDQIEVVSPVSRLPDYYKRYVTRENLLMIYPGNQDDMDGFGAFIVRKKKD